MVVNKEYILITAAITGVSLFLGSTPTERAMALILLYVIQATLYTTAILWREGRRGP